MAAVRQDAWTPEDDLILAEVTLRHIREGGTQLKAFEEVGERIGRTAAACGFRWNSCVRKKYEAAIKIAKEQRKQKLQQRKAAARYGGTAENSSADAEIQGRGEGKHNTALEDQITLDAIIRYLRKWKAMHMEMERRNRQLEKELKEKTGELERLRKENDKLSSEVNEVQNDYQMVNNDYKTLIKIMDRARKLAFLDEDENSKPRFKMDANGNLERVE